MPELDPAGLWATLERIVGLGNRFAGTPGEATCRDLVLEEFARAGLADVRLEEFRYLGYEPAGSSCTVLTDGTEVSCAGLQYSAAAVAEGEAVYLGSCRPEDVEAIEESGVDLAGRVAVAHSYHTWLVAPQLAEKGVAALVNVGETPDGLVGHFPVSFYPTGLEAPWEGRVLPFPGVTIEAQAARRLLSLMTAGPVQIRVEHQGRYAEKGAANVLAEIPGETGERVVVGAHYDTQLEGPGAADNATGVAAVLELARAWRGLTPRRTVVLAAFAVEELAAWGSYSYVVRHHDENVRTVGMVNLDALGLPFPGRRVVVADAAMAPFAREAAAATGWGAEGELDASLYAWGDHNPFIDAGVPACWLWRYPPQHPYYHSAGDVLRYVDLDRTADVATASASVVHRLAHLPELDLGRARPTRTFAALT
jgi:Iap family predicted aminopeptidase